jgi:tRNA (adenine37-N6)-methyltransferase
MKPISEMQLTIKPIGFIQTSFKTKYGAPRQPASSTEKTVGIITLNKHFNFEQALEDLDGLEYIWVLFWFHMNKRWKPKVLPPNSGRKKRGVFSTRAPHRPNPLGLSLCKLLGVKGRTLRIENPDMLDGTPILDIKPYIPHAEAISNARAGWLGEINELSEPPFSVSFAQEVVRELRKAGENGREIHNYVRDILARDPYPHVYRRIKIQKDGTSMIAAKRWRFLFEISEKKVSVTAVLHSGIE